MVVTSAASGGSYARRSGAAATDGWIERLARAGLAARGIVYILVGVIALQAAIGSGTAAGASDALQRVENEWWGVALLALIALGLIGYTIWSLVAAVSNPENDGAAKRVLRALRGLLYGGLAFEAGRLALGASGGRQSGEQASHWTAQLMSQPFGPWLVGGVGVLIAGYGLHRLYQAWTYDLDDRLAIGRLGHTGRVWLRRLARAGLAADGVVLGLIGWFLVNAAVQTNPGEARGLGGALRTLQEQPYGPYLLGVVALGLVAFGVYQLARARYRVVRAPSTGNG